MPFFQLLALASVCLPIAWPAAPWDGPPWRTAAITSGILAAWVGVHIVWAGVLARRVRREPWRGRATAASENLRRSVAAPGLLVVFVLLATLGGWADASAKLTGEPNRPAPLGELLTLAPYFVARFVLALVAYRAERAIHLARSPDEPFGGLGRFLSFRLRLGALFVGLPLAMMICISSAERVDLGEPGSTAVRVASYLLIPILFLAVPAALPRLLKTVPLEAGGLRDRLAQVSIDAGVRVREILVWPTRQGLINAMVVGPVARWRYVVFTDAILEKLDGPELEAVFGHEAGHIRYRHLWLYAAFLMLSGGLAELWTVWAMRDYQGEWPWYYDVAKLAALGLYIFVMFGWLSRRCERQADLAGCESASKMAEREGRPDSEPIGAGLNRAGVLAMASALGRVGDAAGVPIGIPGRWKNWRRAFKAWQHGTIESRIRFLETVSAEPGVAARFGRRVRFYQWGFVAVLLGVLLLTGWAAGWELFAHLVG